MFKGAKLWGFLRFGPGENGRLFGKGGAHSIKYGTSTLGHLTNPKKMHV